MIVYEATKAAEATGMSEEEARKMCEEMFPQLTLDEIIIHFSFF